MEREGEETPYILDRNEMMNREKEGREKERDKEGRERERGRRKREKRKKGGKKYFIRSQNSVTDLSSIS